MNLAVSIHLCQFFYGSFLPNKIEINTSTTIKRKLVNY